MRFTVPLAVLLLVLGFSSAGAFAPVAADRAQGVPPGIEVVSSDEHGMSLVFELEELVTANASVGGEEFQVLSIPGGGFSGEVGAPAIPTFARFVPVPEGATVEVRAVPLEEQEIAGVRLIPVQAGDGSEFAYDPEAYGSTATNAAPRAQVGRSVKFRDLAVAALTFRPVRYDPVRRTALVARRLQVDIAYRGAVRSGARAPRALPASFDRMYQELVLDYQGELDAGTVAPGSCLIICANSTAVVDSLQRLVTWRTRKGMPTQLVTTAVTGTTNSAIKSYIQGLYDDPDRNLEYVVLAGDVGGSYNVATWYDTVTAYHGEGDLPYSQLAGADVLPDVHVGRLSFEDLGTLGHIIDKTVGYEATPYVADTSWFTRSCIVGDPTTPTGWTPVETGRWLAERLAEIGYTEQDTIFAEPFVTQMTTDLSRGDTVFGYRGFYGMSGFGNGQINTLTNGWKMPYVVVITCDTGSFASGTARSEAFLRAWNTSGAVPRGAVGAIGMASTGTHTRYNNCLYYGIWRGLAVEGLHTMGAAKSRGCVELFLNYDDAEPWRVEAFSHWCNLMGDPTVDVWTAVPLTLTVTHPSTIPRGSNAVSVSVAQGGSPVEGAQVCLWKGTETYAVGTTDDQGEVELLVSTPTTGSMLLTVSGHNLKPYQVSIPVVTAGLFVGYSSSQVDDDALGESGGNDDGLINPLETIELPVRLGNFGTLLAPAVTASLSSEDPFVTVTDGAETFGDIPAGGTAWCADDFGFTVHGDCPHGHVARFNLDIQSGAFQGHSLIELEVTSAELVATGSTLYGDNGNGVIDPGETVRMSVRLGNQGGAAANNVTGSLVSLSPRVNVSDPSGTFGTIGIGSFGENVLDRFTLGADPTTYDGYLASLLLITQFSGGVTDTAYLGLTIGVRQSTDPVGPDDYGYLAYDNTDTGYPEAPTYSWLEINPSIGGGGTEVALDDTGPYHEAAREVDLPFPFQYYGETFTKATICSNGWLCFGSTLSRAYRNWTIPGAGGPDAMVAPFWDDLYQVAESKVFQKHDAANHRWIVEWSRMRNSAGGVVETFEAIFYDPVYHPTDSGDGIIEFQYDAVMNNDGGDGYATVGIESPDQLDGVLYTYYNRYPAGAAPLASGRAIKFLPVVEAPIGTLGGMVRNGSAGGTPLADATVSVLGTGQAFSSRMDGRYTGFVSPGTYTVVASHPIFAPDTSAGVVIHEGQLTELDFDLTDIMGPAITTVLHSSTDDTIGPYLIPVAIVEYSGLAEKSLYYRTGANPFTPLALVPQGGGDYLAQIPGQSLGTEIGYYVYARDGIGLESFDPPGAPAQFHRFFVAPIQNVLDDRFESATGWTVGAPDDDATGGIWLRADPVGSTNSGYQIQPEYDHTPDPAALCFVTGNADPGAPAGANDVDDGKTTLFSPVFDLEGYLSASVSYWYWYTNNHGSNPGEDVWQVQVTNNGTDWVTLESTSQTTAESWVQRSFDLLGYIPLSGQVQFRFVASDEGGNSLVEAALDDFLLSGVPSLATGVGPGLSPLVYRTGLDPCRPNPFNPQTQITYRLAEPGMARIVIYDVAGRLIATLVDGRRDAGEYTVRWDGRNAAGREVSSGVYFMRFEALGTAEVRSVALLR